MREIISSAKAFKLKAPKFFVHTKKGGGGKGKKKNRSFPDWKKACHESRHRQGLIVPSVNLTHPPSPPSSPKLEDEGWREETKETGPLVRKTERVAGRHGESGVGRGWGWRSNKELLRYDRQTAATWPHYGTLPGRLFSSLPFASFFLLEELPPSTPTRSSIRNVRGGGGERERGATFPSS